MTKRVVGTVITKSFLAHARTLAESLIEHNSDIELYVLLADRIDDYFDPSVEPFHLIQLNDLPESDVVNQMCFYYTPFELCCALRGYLHEYLFYHTAAESWIFLDADIMVFHSLDKIFQHIEQSSIVLTPHLQTIPTLPTKTNIELLIITAGLYNAGFLGIKRTDETPKFITWFKERLRYYCFNDAAIGQTRGLFVDQRWLDLVPLFFKDVSLLFDPGANLGHWNLYERQLSFDSKNQIVVNQEPLFFVHFSGWDMAHPHQISKYSWLYEEQPESSPWAVLSERYRDSLLRNGYEITTQYPYAFNEFSDGSAIALPMRRVYYDEVMQGIAQAGSPFDQRDYLQSKPYVIESTHYLKDELSAVNQKLTQVQQDAEQLHRDRTACQLSLQESQQQCEHCQAELHHTHAVLQTTATELGHTQAAFQSTEAALHHTQGTLQSIQAESNYRHEVIRAMKNSVFWKLRTWWWKLKQKSGLASIDILESEIDLKK